MREIRRQEYLQTIGIETYIPRWKIPFAAESYLCDQSFSWGDQTEAVPLDVNTQNHQVSLIPTINSSQVLDVVGKNTVKNNPYRVDALLQQFEDRKSLQVQSFSLNVWRPAPGFLVLAARNLNALPTELLLNNFLRFYLQQSQLVLSEEVLRWPAIENSKLALTEKDACAELQTWLSVQHEFQSIKTLWLFGDIYRYFASEFSKFNDEFAIEFCDIKLDQTNPITAKIFPDLSQFLLRPQLKAKLLSLV